MSLAERAGAITAWIECDMHGNRISEKLGLSNIEGSRLSRHREPLITLIELMTLIEKIKNRAEDNNPNQQFCHLLFIRVISPYLCHQWFPLLQEP
jgi:hypothetical protein